MTGEVVCPKCKNSLEPEELKMKKCVECRYREEANTTEGQLFLWPWPKRKNKDDK